MVEAEAYCIVDVEAYQMVDVEAQWTVAVLKDMLCYYATLLQIVKQQQQQQQQQRRQQLWNKIEIWKPIDNLLMACALLVVLQAAVISDLHLLERYCILVVVLFDSSISLYFGNNIPPQQIKDTTQLYICRRIYYVNIS